MHQLRELMGTSPILDEKRGKYDDVIEEIEVVSQFWRCVDRPDNSDSDDYRKAVDEAIAAGEESGIDKMIAAWRKGVPITDIVGRDNARLFY